MTIDMLRHTSLRELVARALYDSPPRRPEPGRFPPQRTAPLLPFATCPTTPIPNAPSV